MTELIGKFIEFGVAVESSRGTAEDSAEQWLKNVTANLVEKAEHATDDNSYGVLADSQQRRVTKKWVEGDVEGIVDANAIGYILYNIFGSVASSNVSGSIHSHDFTVDNSTIEHPSLSFFGKDGDVQQLVYGNGMASSLELSGSNDDYVRFSTSLMASTAEDNSDTPSYDSQLDFVGKDITIKVADTESGLDSAEALKAKEFSITFDKGAISDHVLGNYNPDDIYASKVGIEGSITKNFLDETFKDLYRGDDSKYMKIIIEGSQDLGSGNHPKIEITLNKAQITDWNRSGGNDELVTEKITFKGFYNNEDSQQAKLTLQNLVAEYTNPVSS